MPETRNVNGKGNHRVGDQGSDPTAWKKQTWGRKRVQPDRKKSGGSWGDSSRKYVDTGLRATKNINEEKPTKRMPRNHANRLSPEARPERVFLEGMHSLTQPAGGRPAKVDWDIQTSHLKKRNDEYAGGEIEPQPKIKPVKKKRTV